MAPVSRIPSPIFRILSPLSLSRIPLPYPSPVSLSRIPLPYPSPPLDFPSSPSTLLPFLTAPVAQLDRASDYGSEGCVFESRRVQIKSQSWPAGD
jgi:hypothetical protein